MSHAYEYANGCASVIEVGADDIYYTAGLPLFHVAGKWGVLLGAAIKGATAIMPRQFSATNFWSRHPPPPGNRNLPARRHGELPAAPAAAGGRQPTTACARS